MRGRRVLAAVVAAVLLAACSSGGSDDGGSEAGPDTSDATFLAGAASRSVLPTVEGERAYLDDVPGWDDLDPDDIGVFVPEWDQGQVDVGNGRDDGSWVHDDLRATALALQAGDDLVVMVAVDVYMVFATDAAEIERRARELLPDDVADSARIIISATHLHEGPDTAFSVNPDWYEVMADETAAAIGEAVEAMAPAELSVAHGEHQFGVADARDPLILDPRVNVLSVRAADGGDTIATVVQWGSHPETTLGWDPPVDLTDACAAKGWTGDDCTAEGRYFTADYPGILRTRLQEEVGGEVLYLNGAIGSQIGPGDADVWAVDGDTLADGPSVAPDGAEPVAGAEDYRDQNLARTLAIGEQLTLRVRSLLDQAEPIEPSLAWSEQAYYSRLTNIGFRALLAEGALGWQDATGYTCTERPFTDESCADAGPAVEDDPVLTPLVDAQIRTADVLKTRLVFLDIGGVGFLFMPGELPPELVTGLPDDFTTDVDTYYDEPDLHATGEDYVIPGALLDLVPTEQTFTVGLGGDELGYFVPINEVRVKCLDLVMPPGSAYTCQRLFDEGFLVAPDAAGGPVCRALLDEPDAAILPTGADAREALGNVCRYGQALGQELGEPDGHYEETNSAGWDLVDDTWAAAQLLFAN